MPRVKPCVYDSDRQLMAPRPGTDTSTAHCLSYGGFPTFDIGWYHEFVVCGDGRTYGAAEDVVLRKLRRFFAMMNQVEGFSTLALNRTEGDLGPGGHHITWHIVYVVENTGSPTQDPQSPYPGYQRDMHRLKGRLRDDPNGTGTTVFGS